MGETLITDIAEATGLPQNLVTEELGRLITDAGLTTEEVTLEDLRQILTDYVQEILLAAKAEAADAAADEAADAVVDS